MNKIWKEIKEVVIGDSIMITWKDEEDEDSEMLFATCKVVDINLEKNYLILDSGHTVYARSVVGSEHYFRILNTI